VNVVPSLRRTRLLFVLLTAAACAGTGKYVWVDDYTDRAPPIGEGYVIGPGDVLQVRVFQQEAMSARARVRADGMVSLPFVNDIEAAGYPPTKFAELLQQKLKSFINSPLVTVSVEEVKPLAITILGEVVHPGLYQVEPGAGILQAIAQAGGLTDYARKDRIFVLRQTPALTRIRFDYVALLHASGKGASFRLKTGDAIVLE
jgi:polysaccharide export outer membrane protein